VTGPVPRVAAPPSASPAARPAPRPAVPAPAPPPAAPAAPATPRERTAPVRIDAPPAAAGEAEAKEPVAVFLKRDVNRRWVLIVVGAAAALGALVAGSMWQRSRSIAPSKNRAESAAFEETVAMSRRLLDDGNRFLAEGKLEEARKAFADLVRRAPDSAPARDSLRRTQQLIAKKAELDRRNEQVARRLEAARAARDASRWPVAASEASAALALEPDNAEAKGLEALALESIRKLPKGARARAEAEMRTLKSAPAAAAPASAAAAPPADLPLSVTFRSPVPEGWLFVRFGDREVFRRAFEFGPGAGGGLVEGHADLPPGSGEFRVWVIAADGSVRDYATRKVERTGNEKRTLVVELDAARKLSLAVK
jgi:hypothetical protein